jgi:hypothetical protein
MLVADVGHTHNPGGTSVKGIGKHRMCQPVLQTSHNNMVSDSSGEWHTSHERSSGTEDNAKSRVGSTFGRWHGAQWVECTLTVAPHSAPQDYHARLAYFLDLENDWATMELKRVKPWEMKVDKVPCMEPRG